MNKNIKNMNKIKYCHSCHCMTHNKEGFTYICGKCGKDRRQTVTYCPHINTIVENGKMFCDDCQTFIKNPCKKESKRKAFEKKICKEMKPKMNKILKQLDKEEAKKHSWEMWGIILKDNYLFQVCHDIDTARKKSKGLYKRYMKEAHLDFPEIKKVKVSIV